MVLIISRYLLKLEKGIVEGRFLIVHSKLSELQKLVQSNMGEKTLYCVSERFLIKFSMLDFISFNADLNFRASQTAIRYKT
ncbi:hypothetical protein B0T49_03720 [Chromobacterium violaceum]|nr:hypothetical protein B0T48_03720 [Chromobacterium violaceum]OQS52921.1 hypothetical protein B0T49_03720 [Chromobacterium violaceum]